MLQMAGRYSSISIFEEAEIGKQNQHCTGGDSERM